MSFLLVRQTFKLPLFLFIFLAIPETAFLYAINSAGIAYSLAWACSTGQTKDCACDKPRPLNYSNFDLLKEQAKRKPNHPLILEDKKCLTNSIKYGIDSSRKLLENKHQSDIRWRMDNHNKEAGRRVSYQYSFINTSTIWSLSDLPLTHTQADFPKFNNNSM